MKESDFLVIDVGGAGYKVYTSDNTLQKAGINSDFTVYTYLHIREDIFDIYGFATKEELSTFELLISVSGVGPKAALAILSGMTPDKFALAVIHSDIKAITAAQGIGKKIAERIIVELKDKISREMGSAGVSLNIPETDPSTSDEAVNALMVLGYSALEAKGAVIAVKDSCSSVEDIIKKALTILM